MAATKTIRIEPTREFAVPYDPKDQKPKSNLDKLKVAGNTAEVLESLGALPEMDKKQVAQEAKLITKAVTQGDVDSATKSLPAAYAASAFLRVYGQYLAFDVAKVRAALTNKLLEIADCGDVKYELRAIELLGKHSDIGLFTERSEVTVKYDDPDKLQEQILKRVKTLLNTDAVDKKPFGADLDVELGIVEGHFEEVKDEDGQRSDEHSDG